MAEKRWKKGRGKLGPLAPLLGIWETSGESPMGPFQCTRGFERILGNGYLQMRALWMFGEKVGYEEWAVFGTDKEGNLVFWSFTSDGKNSQGKIADVSDIHPEAIGFEAQMPAGLARQAYWPDNDNGFHWVVEAQTKKGWSRFTEHHYKPAQAAMGEHERAGDDPVEEA